MPLALVVLALAAGVVFSRIYHGPVLFGLVAGAAVLPVALSVVLRRLASAVAVVTSVVALAGYLLVATVLTRDPAAGGLATVYLDALRNSGARILTSTFPVEPAPDTVLLPVLIVWAAGLAGAELAVRHRKLLLGLAPSALAYGLALAFVGPNARPSIWVALAYLGVAATTLALTREDTSGEVVRQLPAGQRVAYRGRGMAIGATALVLLMGATIGIGTGIAELKQPAPKDPRTYVSPPEEQEPESNPLGRLSQWARHPDDPLFDISMDQPKRIRWVVLNDYDGLNWTPEGRYRSAGTVLPAPPAPRGTTTVRQQVTVTGLNGAWLPAVEQPTELTGIRVSYDSATGTVLQPTGLKPGLRYNVVSEFVDAPDAGRVVQAESASGPAVDRFLAVPGTAPQDIRELASEITSKTTRPYRKALAIEAHLSKQYRYVPDAASGHGYANLEFFLDGSPEQGGRKGTSEQFASAFALMARMAGLPSRVVMGFHTGRAQGGGSYQVRSGDAFAWPEVFFAGHGWVSFDPTPSAGENTDRPADEQTKEAAKQREAKAQQLDAIEDEQAPETELDAIDDTKQPTEERLSTGARIGIGAGAAALVLAMVPLVLLMLRRRLRRRRLSRGTPSQRVVGAWWELLDGLTLAGHRPSPDLTAGDIARVAADPWPRGKARRGKRAEAAAAAGGEAGAAAAARGGDGVAMAAARGGDGVAGVAARGDAGPLPAVGELAELVNMVAFAPGLADDGHAEAAARVVTGYISDLRGRRSWWRKALWSTDPRPLLWRRRRESAPAPLPVPPAAPPVSPPPAQDEGVDSGAFAPSRDVHAGSDFASVSTERAAATTKQ